MNAMLGRDGDPYSVLLLTIATMFIGALAAGALPYWVRIRESRVALLAALGGGLLIGTALAVIVPEGFHAFAEAQEAAGHGHDEHDHDEHDHGHGHEGAPEGLTGLALVAGFLCMLLLDHAQHAAGGSHSVPGHSHGGGGGGAHRHGHRHGKGEDGKCGGDDSGPVAPLLTGGEAAAHAAAAEPAAACGAKATGTPPPGGDSAERAVTGLLIHCAADGLAIGAAALAGNARLSLMVGVAMVLHKAPMAFGLATFLMGSHWPWARARRTLLAFAAAAPASALATYSVLGLVPALTSPTAVALAVLFSGGTFLYAAAMHILPEVLGGCGGAAPAQLAAVAAGALAPVLLSWGHSH